MHSDWSKLATLFATYNQTEMYKWNFTFVLIKMHSIYLCEPLAQEVAPHRRRRLELKIKLPGKFTMIRTINLNEDIDTKTR